MCTEAYTSQDINYYEGQVDTTSQSLSWLRTAFASSFCLFACLNDGVGDLIELLIVVNLCRKIKMKKKEKV